jgi:hypothetical protein
VAVNVERNIITMSIERESEHLMRLKSNLMHFGLHRDLAGAIDDVVEIERHLLHQIAEIEAALIRVHDLSKDGH